MQDQRCISICYSTEILWSLLIGCPSIYIRVAHKKVTTVVEWNEKSRDNNVQMRCLLRSNANLMNAIHLIVASSQQASFSPLFPSSETQKIKARLCQVRYTLLSSSCSKWVTGAAVCADFSLITKTLQPQRMGRLDH